MDEPYVHKIFTEADSSENGFWLGKSGFSGEAKDADIAVFAYPIKHYTAWQNDLQRPDLDIGSMGEHFSVLEMDEFTVCIGDVFQMGNAVLQVSQPYQPYWDPSADREIVQQMQQSGKTGWYFRVLEEGYVQPQTDLALIEQPYSRWSVAACNEVLFLNQDDLRLAHDLLECDLLAKSWKRPLKQRLFGKVSAERKLIYNRS
ncbi:MOSC domain-containing protein [Lentibacillus sediminis]|uniref:MOSC domain-containing protein n=1 Tax=Lentibacillus sediminis TaxID=1940529 RepID=UPI000C1C02E7|nr:MOSC domain-containing protein [Lentibacillus sediminis]